ncbi:MAG: T9SS type A sorting domain-containing protein [Lacibacter sp.]
MKQTLHSFFLLLICITLFICNSVYGQLRVQAGKSYINISKPTGGIIENGDELEIRAVISVTGGSTYFTRYNDTIPAGTTYKANSIRFSTNEGMYYGTPLRVTGLLTDAGADDEATCNSGVLRVNLGSLTRTGGQTAAYNAIATPAVIDVLPAASGCRIYNTGRPSFYGGTCIIMVIYRVYVNTTAGSTFNIPGGTFRYKTANTFSEVTLPSVVKPLNKMTVIVSNSMSVCNAVGSNSISGNGGNFGSGSSQNLSPAPAPGTVVPGYLWQPFSSGTGPNDSAFTVANNTSTNGSTNTALPYPSSPARLFGVWDIIGDHTNASDPLAGNPPTTPGQVGGYMAVVNAAYGINNAVQQTVTGLCPDTYYEFSAWFRNICRRCSCDTSGKGSGSAGFKSYMSPTVPNTNDSAGVLPNLTFQIDGVDHYITGNLDYNGQWAKKGFLYKTGSSQTSLNIVIRNNAPGGGGNDWVMDDVVFATCLPGLEMKPTTTPAYCIDGEVDLSVIVKSFYNNYSYYQWEMSADNGVTWVNAPLAPVPQILSYTYSAPDYIDTVHYPTFLASSAMNGYKFRIRIATSLSNLSNTSCAVYNTTDVITIDVHPVCDILSAEKINLKADLINNNSVVSWRAMDDENISSYEIQRSDDGIHFKKAGEISAVQDGNNGHQYKFVDGVASGNKIFYRLKLFTANGNYKTTTIVKLSLPSVSKMEIVNLVNPFDQQVKLIVSSPVKQAAEISLKDITGRTVKSQKAVLQNGYNSIFISPDAALQKGTYILQVRSSEEIINKIIQKK